MAALWSSTRRDPWPSALRALVVDGRLVKAEEEVTAAIAEALAASGPAEIVILTAADETGATDNLLQ